ncbi:MAG: fibronectin type III domain-containing protein [Candidatus Latescibacteria bacterium]|nr:fibronectin type III domain-containing protein [Candidatus Latescibacterota bacterium]
MKKLYLIPALLIAVGAVVLFTGCEDIIGDKPTNVILSAATDTSVMITWAAPATAPDKYLIYFKGVGQASYASVGEATTTTFTHNPGGATGKYFVAAKYGSDEYDSDVKSTEPIATASTSLSELNATGNSGYGWNRTSFAGTTYSMAEAANASAVDLYLTNFAAGFAATPYNIASPDMGPTDPGGVVPAGSWRVNAISDPITDPQLPLPKHTTTTYFNYIPLNAYPTYLAVYTADGYYGLIKIDGLNTGAGTVTIESRFQAVKGLRLIQH